MRAASAARLTASLKERWAKIVASGAAPQVIVEPALLAGRVLTPRIVIGRAPGAPEVELEIDAGTVGANSVSVEMVSPSGAHSVYDFGTSLPIYPPQTRHTRFALQVTSPFGQDGFSIYTEAGNWTVQQVAVQSNDGNSTNYSGGELASVFPNPVVDIVNREQDITMPTAGAGAVLTPTVSLSSASPVFAASLVVADNLSGVSSVSLSIMPPGGNGFSGQEAYTSLAAPLVRGTAYPAERFSSSAATGTYSITGYSVCDYAGNCLSDSVAADIKKTFGTTTFEVTQ